MYSPGLRRWGIGRTKKLKRDLRRLADCPKVPRDEFERRVYEENPPDFADEIVAAQVWPDDIDNVLLFRLLDFLALQEAGCPLGRHELTNAEWRLLGHLKRERDLMAREKSRPEGVG